MPQKNIAHVLYAIENTDMSSMPKIVIFDVLCAISVNLTVRGVEAVGGLHTSVGKGKVPLLPQLLRRHTHRLPRRSPDAGHPRK
jgi:hypothetical protein